MIDCKFVALLGPRLDVLAMLQCVQVPGYLKHAEDLKKLNVDEVLVFCVNDVQVMDAWAKDQGPLA